MGTLSRRPQVAVPLRATAPMPSHSMSWQPSAASLSRKIAPLIRAAKWSAVGRCSEVRLSGWEQSGEC